MEYDPSSTKLSEQKRGEMHFQAVVSAMSFVTANDTQMQKEAENFQSFVHDSFITTNEASFGKKVETVMTEEQPIESKPQAPNILTSSILDQSVPDDVVSMPF